MVEKHVWLCLEGQNFADSIFDTQDLSTIRGGSLLLRDLVDRADQWLKGALPGKITLATRGGSVGIWRLDIAGAEAGLLLGRLRKHLGDAPFRHLSFGLAAVEEDSPSYTRQRNRLKAAIQRQRLTQSRIAYPVDGTKDAVCEVDFVRPATGSHKVGPGKTILVSASVDDRRAFGREMKHRLVSDETRGEALGAAAQAWLERHKNVERPLAMQINSISEGAKPSVGLRANLADKICVITLDGNGFGKIQDGILEKDDSIEGQKRFDEALAGLRAKIISAVFSTLIEEGGYGPPSVEEMTVREKLSDPTSEVARFELLLWGGDEIMFIVPARLGWPMLETIAETVSKADLLAEPVSFSIGAVFCHHDAPIARIKALSDDLASHIKKLKIEDGRGRDGKATTLALVEVLEAFDHIGKDLGKHLLDQVPKPTGEGLSLAEKKAFRTLNLSELKSLRRAAEDLAAGKGGQISRGRLRQVAYALHQGKVPGAAYRGEGKWKEFVVQAAKDLSGCAGLACQGDPNAANPEAIVALGQDKFFSLLEAYWDYLVPIRQDGVGQENHQKVAAE